MAVAGNFSFPRTTAISAGGGTAGNSGRHINSFAMAQPTRDALRDAHVLDRALQHHQQERDEPQQHQLCHQRFKMKP